MRIYIDVPETSVISQVFGAAGIVEDIDPTQELNEAVSMISGYAVEYLRDSDATAIANLLSSAISEAVRCRFAAGLERAASEISNRQSIADP